MACNVINRRVKEVQYETTAKSRETLTACHCTVLLAKQNTSLLLILLLQAKTIRTNLICMLCSQLPRCKVNVCETMYHHCLPLNGKYTLLLLHQQHKLIIILSTPGLLCTEQCRSYRHRTTNSLLEWRIKAAAASVNNDNRISTYATLITLFAYPVTWQYRLPPQEKVLLIMQRGKKFRWTSKAAATATAVNPEGVGAFTAFLGGRGLKLRG